MSNIQKITSLVKEKEKLERIVKMIDGTKHWTKISVSGEDGAENRSSFEIGGPGDNDKANLNLVEHLHENIRMHYKTRMKEVNEQIEKLLK